MSDALTHLGLTLRQDFQAWLMQLQLDDLSAEQPLSDQVDQFYKLVQDLTVCEQISASWGDLEAWLTSGFLPSDAGEINFLPPDPSVVNFLHSKAQNPHLPNDMHRMEYPEHPRSQEFKPIDAIVPSTAPFDLTSMTSGRLDRSSVTTVDRDQRLFAADGADAVIDRAVAKPMMPNRLAALSVLPDRIVPPSPPNHAAATLPASVGTRNSLPLKLPPTDSGINWDSGFTPELSGWPVVTDGADAVIDRADAVIDHAVAKPMMPNRLAALSVLPDRVVPPSPPNHSSALATQPVSVGDDDSLPRLTPDVKGMKELSAFLQQAKFEPINAPVSAHASEQPFGQSAMSLDEQPDPLAFPQRYSKSSVWLNPPPREDAHWFTHDWTQDGASPSIPSLESALPPLGQTSSGLLLSPIAAPQTLPRSVTAPDAGSTAPSEPSLLDLDCLLEAIQQEINQDYDRFYGS